MRSRTLLTQVPFVNTVLVALTAFVAAVVARDRLEDAASTEGLLMIGLTLYVAYVSGPPVGEALRQTIFPDTINFATITTIVGGTVGGYITYSGAHRLLDKGLVGEENLAAVTKASLTGIAVTDSRTGTFDSPFPTSLAPGASATRTFTSTITQADANNGNVDNTASVTTADADVSDSDTAEALAGTSAARLMRIVQPAPTSDPQPPMLIRVSTRRCGLIAV